MVRAIFFDFDGVLVDSEPLHFACWLEALAGQGIQISSDEYARRYIGVSDSLMVDILCQQFGKPGDRPAFAACKERKESLYRERASAAFQIPSGLQAFLEMHCRTYLIGVVSSSNRLDVEPHLVSHNVRQAVSVLVCCEDVHRLKPAPDPYLRALEMARATGAESLIPEDCLAVEDSDAGVESARQAGMPVVRVPHPEVVVGLVEAALRSDAGARKRVG